jgi:bacterioferritin
MKQNSTQEPVFSVAEVRQHAEQSWKEGALTSDYSLDVKQACDLLNQALASEILCVLRYQNHYFAAKGINYPQVAAEFKEHAQDEQEHVLLIAERINQLGGVADFNPASISQRSATEYGTSDGLLAMIKEDLIAERIAIEVYRNMVRWFGEADSTTRRMLEEILEDEESHANEMADLLVRMDPTLSN